MLCKHEVAGSIPVTSTKLLTDCIELQFRLRSELYVLTPVE